MQARRKTRGFFFRPINSCREEGFPPLRDSICATLCAYCPITRFRRCGYRKLIKYKLSAHKNFPLRKIFVNLLVRVAKSHFCVNALHLPHSCGLLPDKATKQVRLKVCYNSSALRSRKFSVTENFRELSAAGLHLPHTCGLLSVSRRTGKGRVQNESTCSYHGNSFL